MTSPLFDDVRALGRFPYAAAARSITCERARQSFANLSRNDPFGDADGLLRRVVRTRR